MFKMLTSLQLDQTRIGRKTPLEGRARMKWCLPCSKVNSTSCLNTCVHLVEECQVVQHIRKKYDIQEYFEEVIARGGTRAKAFSDYVNGLDVEGVMVTREEYMARGAAVVEMHTAWLKEW
jgi:hypothetical protein